MPTVAVLSDIHANIPALTAVADDLRQHDPDEVLVGGDLVGRGPQGKRVVEMIDELGWQSIRGNHEDYLLEFRRRDVPDEWLTADVWAASRWMARELDDWHAEFIDDLPLTRTARTAPDLRLYHGSPDSYHDGIGDWTSDQTIRDHLASIDEPVLVCAHTHRPLIRRFEEGLVVNSGSVGLPFDGDWRAQYVLLEKNSTGWHAELRRLEYDRERFLEIYDKSGFLQEGGITASILRMEVQVARPYLVPFMRWTDIEDVTPTEERFSDFLDIYDPQMSMRAFFEILDSD